LTKLAVVEQYCMEISSIALRSCCSRSWYSYSFISHSIDLIQMRN